MNRTPYLPAAARSPLDIGDRIAAEAHADRIADRIAEMAADPEYVCYLADIPPELNAKLLEVVRAHFDLHAAFRAALAPIAEREVLAQVDAEWSEYWAEARRAKEQEISLGLAA